MSLLEISSENGLIKQEDLTKYENDFQTNIKDKYDLTRSRSNKCGEIFLEENDTVVILCTYCEDFFTQFAEFMLHLKDKHSIKEHKKNKIDSPKTDVKLEVEPDVEMFAFIDFDAISHDITTEIDNHGKNSDTTLSESTSCKKKITNAFKSVTRLERKVSSTRCRKSIKSLPFNTSSEIEKHRNRTTDHKSPVPHTESNDGDDCEENNGKFSELVSNETNESLKKCRFCSRKFTNEKNRAVHERIHTEQGPFKCEICSKYFSSKSRLKVHKTLHDDKRPFKCAICNIAFKDNSNLKAHEKRHTGEKNYQCSYCDKSFYQKAEKTQHERTHTGERPYQCNECGKCFARSGELTVHSRRHSGEKPHKCEYCGKCFVSKKPLKEHLIVHSNDRPLSCDVCNATFSRKKTLESHKKIHSDVTGYVCKICGKGFKQGPGLYSHMKRHNTILKKF